MEMGLFILKVYCVGEPFISTEGVGILPQISLKS